MINALKTLVVSVLVLACLFVAIDIFLGFSSFSRYRPERIQRHGPPNMTDHSENETGVEESADEDQNMTKLEAENNASQTQIVARD